MEKRFASIDVARGIIMIIMAIDHCGGSWASQHGMGEVVLPAGRPFHYASGAVQVMREITHICAPGFQLLAGLGLAISVYRRQRSGASELMTSLDMALRGFFLILCDWILMYYAFGKSPFLFLVLCCIGSSTILFSVLRFLPRWLILAFGVLTLGLQPLYCPETTVESTSALSYFVNIWRNVAFSKSQWFIVMYPIFPWIGYFAIGWFLGGQYASGNRPPMASMLGIAIALLVSGIAVRRFGGLAGDRIPGGELGLLHPDFWLMAKYPPSPFFSLITLSSLFAQLGLLQPLDEPATRSVVEVGHTGETTFTPRSLGIWSIPQLFGRVALFFFVVHFYLYGLYPHWSNTEHTYSLTVTMIAWAAGLIILYPICVGYDKLRNRHRSVLRYF